MTTPARGRTRALTTAPASTDCVHTGVHCTGVNRRPWTAFRKNSLTPRALRRDGNTHPDWARASKTNRRLRHSLTPRHKSQALYIGENHAVSERIEFCRNKPTMPKRCVGSPRRAVRIARAGRFKATQRGKPSAANILGHRLRNRAKGHMAAQTTLQQITDGLTELVKAIDPDTFIFDFLRCYGLPKSTISRLRAGATNGAKRAGCVLLRKKIHFEALSHIAHGASVIAPENALAAAKTEKVVIANHPRFLIATDFNTVAAYDTKLAETTTFPIKELHENYTFFLPLAGMERAVVHEEIAADARAAEYMAKLYDLVRADNPPKTNDDRHALNVFMTRLLFCYFAEDTGIFPQQAFTRAISQFTQADGSDVGAFIQDLFAHVSTPPKPGGKTKQHLSEFPYVNGGLFNDTKAKHAASPRFTAKSRQRLIDLGVLDWSKINPDIFGSMFQAVVDVDKRGELGMHYTSVPNIMKVIGPLFLDELNDELAAAKGSKAKLYKLLERLRRLRFLDPACGSGNFLIITYKELRRLEMRVFNELLHVAKQLPLELCGIHVNQFHGIELDDFAAKIAGLAMWLAEHQMNIEFQKEFSKTLPSLPLKEGAHITQGNATRMPWSNACPTSDNVELFIMGNPPYVGARNQTAEQKTDMAITASHIDGRNNLDYIALFFLKGAEFIRQHNGLPRLAFVTTNSICQGEQVSLLWPHILTGELRINFAYPSFKWSNNAKSGAAVACAVVGLSSTKHSAPNRLFTSSVERKVAHISPYLIDSATIYIHPAAAPLSNIPSINYGSFALDDGHFTLSRSELDTIITAGQASDRQLTRPFLGTKEFINGIERHCIWVEDAAAKAATDNAEIRRRIAAVKLWRTASTRKSTAKLAATPHRFAEIRQPNGPYVAFPTLSSERRLYIPVGRFDASIIASNQLYVIETSENWIFAAVSSRMHMTWVRAVSGRLEDRIRYSSSICYNNFPFPSLTIPQRQQLTLHAEAILLTREKHPDKTISNLYDPDTMPADLLAAHQALDLTVDGCYRTKPFTSDEERLEHLFALYEKMTATERAAGHPATPQKRPDANA